VPYWQINCVLCLSEPGWREWQKDRPMNEIIPHIDERIATRNSAPTPGDAA
jgi:hypothetical protein